ncbi:MAG: hypothetical protein ACI8ZM_000749 [Crocinitomix sp.]|jgi:hypothetical protein
MWALLLFCPFIYACTMLIAADKFAMTEAHLVLFFGLYVLAGTIWYYIIKHKRKRNFIIYWWEHVVMFLFCFTALTGFVYLVICAILGAFIFGFVGDFSH